MDNRSMPSCAVIPELAYPDPGQAADWLCNAFGFTIRLRIGNHRVQLNAGDGALVVTEAPAEAAYLGSGHGVMVRVADVDRHHRHSLSQRVNVTNGPETHPYGERQYRAEDFAGHQWTFSQSVADVDPRDWGGEPGDGAPVTP